MTWARRETLGPRAPWVLRESVDSQECQGTRVSAEDAVGQGEGHPTEGLG